MKKNVWFILWTLFTLTALPFCKEDDPINPANGLDSKNSGSENSSAKGTLPSLKLVDLRYVTCYSAIADYEITDIGEGSDSAIIGVCWNTSSNPTVDNYKTKDRVIYYRKVSSFVSASAGLENLNHSTTYYVRAYATNNKGTAYSNELTFKTNASTGQPSIISAAIYPPSLSCTGVIMNWVIIDNGGNPIINRGVCLSTEPNPTVQDKISYAIFDSESDLGGIRYYSEIDGLQPATKYHARPFFSTVAGTFYGDDISFTTNPKPSVKTSGVTGITRTSATISGNVTSTGGSFVIARGICFGTTPNPVLAPNQFIEQVVQSYEGTGAFSETMTNLTPGKTYYVRAFVYVMTGIEYGDTLIEYGEEINFTTTP